MDELIVKLVQLDEDLAKRPMSGDDFPDALPHVQEST